MSVGRTTCLLQECRGEGAIFRVAIAIPVFWNTPIYPPRDRRFPISIAHYLKLDIQQIRRISVGSIGSNEVRGMKGCWHA